MCVLARMPVVQLANPSLTHAEIAAHTRARARVGARLKRLFTSGLERNVSGRAATRRRSCEALRSDGHRFAG